MSGLLRRIKRSRAADAGEAPAEGQAAAPEDARTTTEHSAGVTRADQPVTGRATRVEAGSGRPAPAGTSAIRTGAPNSDQPDRATTAAIAADPNLPAGVDPADAAVQPPKGRRGRLRRRLRYLRRARELMLRDLGGLVYEVHRTGGGDVAAHGTVIGAKVERLASLDAEAAAIETALASPRGETVVFQPGVGGTCDSCGELCGTTDRFCSHCGAPTGAAVVTPPARRGELARPVPPMPKAPAEAPTDADVPTRVEAPADAPTRAATTGPAPAARGAPVEASPAAAGADRPGTAPTDAPGTGLRADGPATGLPADGPASEGPADAPGLPAEAPASEAPADAPGLPAEAPASEAAADAPAAGLPGEAPTRGLPAEAPVKEAPDGAPTTDPPAGGSPAQPPAGGSPAQPRTDASPPEPPADARTQPDAPADEAAPAPPGPARRRNPFTALRNGRAQDNAAPELSPGDELARESRS